MKEHIVYKVQPGSIAKELEIEPGDALLSVNGHGIEDVFDYHYYTNEEFLTVVIRKGNGEEWELEIEKGYEEDLGIEFENGLGKIQYILAQKNMAVTGTDYTDLVEIHVVVPKGEEQSLTEEITEGTSAGAKFSWGNEVEFAFIEKNIKIFEKNS